MEIAINIVSMAARFVRLAVWLETRIVFISSWITPKKASILHLVREALLLHLMMPRQPRPTNEEEDPFLGGRKTTLLLSKIRHVRIGDSVRAYLGRNTCSSLGCGARHLHVQWVATALRGLMCQLPISAAMLHCHSLAPPCYPVRIGDVH